MLTDVAWARALRQKLEGGVTVERVVRSLRFRTMRNLARLDAVRTLAGVSLRRVQDVRSPIFPGATVERCLDALRRDGLAFGVDLPRGVLDEIRAWTDESPCFGNLNPKWGFYRDGRAEAQRKAGKTFTVAHYFNAQECPAIKALVDDPFLNEVARQYVGPGARFTCTHVWWSFANEVSAAERDEWAQLFHFDLDDYRFVKVFFYLTDVDEESGPHVYVRGTHRGKPLRHMYPMRRLSDDEVRREYGADREVHICGRAGTGFFEDTFGIHKGLPPRTKDRLVLQLEFAQRYYSGDDVVPHDRLKLL